MARRPAVIARRIVAAGVFVSILLLAGPQPTSPRFERERAVRFSQPPPAVGPGGRAIAPPPLAWRGAVRAGIPAPRKVRHVDPIYPEGARQERIEGVVVLEILIDEGGVVEDARVVRSIGLLDRAALDAVREWRFTPSLLNDKPVKMILTVNVNFAIRE